LEGIAETLLGANENRLAGKGFAAPPGTEGRVRGVGLGTQPPFIFEEPAEVIARGKIGVRSVCMGFYIFRVKAHCLEVTGLSRVELTLIGQDISEVVVGTRRIREKPNRVTVARFRLVDPAQVTERVAEVGEQFRIIGLEVEGFAIAGQGLVEPSELGENESQVVVRLGKGRAEADGSLQALHSLVQVPLGGKEVCQVEMGFHEVGLEPESFEEGCPCLLGFAKGLQTRVSDLSEVC